MRYYKEIENGYITSIGQGFDGVEITEEEYKNILAIIQNRPIADVGYDYRLKEDLTWELVEVEVIDTSEEEITDEEALAIILGGA